MVLTPMMKQYFELKAKHPDAVMLFRCGDFYETYSEDAIVAAEILGITLTKRANGQAKHVEMAGFPFHALDTYLPKFPSNMPRLPRSNNTSFGAKLFNSLSM